MQPQQIIRRPLITEKSTRLKEAANTICFEVARDANKIEIGRAVTALFGVQVAEVRVANRGGKLKRMGRFVGRRPSRGGREADRVLRGGLRSCP